MPIAPILPITAHRRVADVRNGHAFAPHCRTRWRRPGSGTSVPNGLLGLCVEELHALDVDREAAPLPRLHGRTSIHPSHTGPASRELPVLLRSRLSTTVPGWHWQVGEFTAPRADGGAGSAYLALLGPTDSEHHWRLRLAPGASFTTVPVAIAVSGEGFEGAIASLTACRRAVRRPHQDHRRLPVIFNDYMNTLNGDPTTERLLPLIAAAARVGAEYFCIDAGWYADIGEGWWDSVGLWQPS